MAKLILLDPAQKELEEIVQMHRNLVGKNAAEGIMNRILNALSQLELFPLSGSVLRNPELSRAGYRYLIVGKYLCFYKVIDQTVYVYHIAHGATDYPHLFQELQEKEQE